MAKIGMRNMKYAGRAADLGLAKALLGIVAVGVAGGATLITGAKKVGNMIESRRQVALDSKAESNAMLQDEIEVEFDNTNGSDIEVDYEEA